MELRVSTAADRAAADMQRVGREKAAMTSIVIAAQTVDKVVNGLFKWEKARKRQSNVE